MTPDENPYDVEADLDVFRALSKRIAEDAVVIESNMVPYIYKARPRNMKRDIDQLADVLKYQTP